MFFTLRGRETVKVVITSQRVKRDRIQLMIAHHRASTADFDHISSDLQDAFDSRPAIDEVAQKDNLTFRVLVHASTLDVA